MIRNRNSRLNIRLIRVPPINVIHALTWSISPQTTYLYSSLRSLGQLNHFPPPTIRNRNSRLNIRLIRFPPINVTHVLTWSIYPQTAYLYPSHPKGVERTHAPNDQVLIRERSGPIRIPTVNKPSQVLAFFTKFKGVEYFDQSIAFLCAETKVFELELSLQLRRSFDSPY
ncbi:hypothetical protein AVEN_38328-1 [Araneus ventricosus]|uniref:Uncharacterized protein n=1 Tax=Araneus ventricosus TaxID=182803 RepID=A0A4Y2P7Z4_ARAVE|nr:hypothetical protein AVEN_38328-1 [Araneus ventricosus]